MDSGQDDYAPTDSLSLTGLMDESVCESPCPSRTTELLVSTGRVSSLSTWDIRTATPRGRVPSNEGCDLIRLGESTIAQSELKRQESCVVFWNIEDESSVENGKPLRRLCALAGHSDDINRLCHIPSSRGSSQGFVASASKDNDVKIWSIDLLCLQSTLEGHSRDVYGVCFEPDTRNLVSCGWDKSVIVWDLPAEKQLFSLTGFSGELVDCVVAGRGDVTDSCVMVSGAGGDNSLKILDLRVLDSSQELEQVCTICLQHPSGIYCSTRVRCDSSPMVLTGDHNGYVAFWDLRQPSGYVSRVRRHAKSVWYIEQLPRPPQGMEEDTECFAFVSTGYESVLRFWTLQKEAVPLSFEKDGEDEDETGFWSRQVQYKTQVAECGKMVPCWGRTYGLCYIGFDEWEWGEFAGRDELERCSFVIRGMETVSSGDLWPVRELARITFSSSLIILQCLLGLLHGSEPL